VPMRAPASGTAAVGSAGRRPDRNVASDAQGSTKGHGDEASWRSGHRLVRLTR
jgi:hypothetical protein